MPERIQRRRTKGWKMPPNTKDVTRSSRYGNLFKIGDQVANVYWGELSEDEKLMFPVMTIQDANGAIYLFRKFQLPKMNVEELRGYDLACYCKEGDPCHADLLLEISNS